MYGGATGAIGSSVRPVGDFTRGCGRGCGRCGAEAAEGVEVEVEVEVGGEGASLPGGNNNVSSIENSYADNRTSPCSSRSKSTTLIFEELRERVELDGDLIGGVMGCLVVGYNVRAEGWESKREWWESSSGSSYNSGITCNVRRPL